MTTITADRLIDACSDESTQAGIRIRTELESLGGPNAKVKPATYAGGVFQLGRRWWGEGENRRAVDVITIDNEPSQANRLEAALESARAELGLPEFVLDLSDLEPLPPHVPRRLSSFRFPHRNADAYLRDAKLGDEDFLKSEIGRAVFGATADNADALVRWMPQALLFGFWQSHLGKKGSQAKHARAWTSEIIGIEPATPPEDGLEMTEGIKGDPLNLVKDDNRIDFDPNNTARWNVAEPRAKPALGKIEDLAEVGHGQVPVAKDKRALSAVSFLSVVQQATVSFASLRRVYTTVGTAEARALLTAVGLVSHTKAFGRSFHLRSGCDLRPIEQAWTWLGSDGSCPIDALTTEQATDLFLEVVEVAKTAGLPVGSNWAEPLVLEPKDNLRKAIRNTFPDPEDS